MSAIIGSTGLNTLGNGIGTSSTTDGDGRYDLPSSSLTELLYLNAVTLMVTTIGDESCKAHYFMQNGASIFKLTKGWIRGDEGYEIRDSLDWTGRIALTSSKNYLGFGIRNESGGNINWIAYWTVEALSIA